MENSSKVTTIILTALYGMDDLKYFYAVFFFMIYMVIVFANGIMIFVICTNKALHLPMYFFLCNLAANGLYGGTALLPPLLSTLMSPSHEVSLACCQTQIFCIHTFAIVEFTILAVMCYDRYVAICYPLQYHSIMPLTKVYKLIAFSWGYPFAAFAVFLSMTIQLTLCQNTIDRVYCINYALVKLSCKKTDTQNVLGLLSVVVYTIPQLVMTLYSYARILKICLNFSKEAKLKALRTCVPHLLSITNYSVGCFFEIVQSRFNTSHLSYESQVFMSLFCLIFPPILNPAIYGLSIYAVRVNIFKLLKNVYSCRQLLPTKRVGT